MSASWYDVLGVAPDATEDEIRTAWRAATSDLEPTDRRFDLYNQAAKVLLDADAREDYDREQESAGPAGSHPVTEPDEAAGAEPDRAEAEESTARDESSVAAEPAPDVDEARTRHEGRAPAGVRGWWSAGVPTWLIAGLALAVLLVSGVAAFVHLRGDDSAEAGSGHVHEAQAVLEQSFGDLLTYRYDELEAAHQRATALLTPRYQCEFDKVWALVEEQAEKIESVVKTEVVRSGVTRVSADGERVELVALIRNEVTNSGGDQGVGTLLLGVTMVESDGAWLVDEVDGLEGGEAAQDADPCASEAPSTPSS